MLTELFFFIHFLLHSLFIVKIAKKVDRFKYVLYQMITKR